jgi:hypothetical protein
MTAQNGRNARRRIRDKGRRFITDSVAFMVIGLRKDGKVGFVAEVSALGDAENDPRHDALTRLVAGSPDWCDQVETAYQRMKRIREQSQKVSEAKETRSKELSGDAA